MLSACLQDVLPYIHFCWQYFLNYGYQICNIFIGSPDTGYHFIYLLYLIWSRNASAIKPAENISAALRKNGRQKPFWTGIKST